MQKRPDMTGNRLMILLLCLIMIPFSAQADPESSPLKVQSESDRQQTIPGGDSDELVSLYDLNYAVIGTDTAKTLISIKFRPFPDTPLYLTYSNLLLWDIYKSSSPYRDINFIMEAFYRFHTPFSKCQAIDMGGWHNSNGMDDEESRAWERAFVRFNLSHELEGVTLMTVTNFHVGLRTSSNNGDISDYLGFWDLSLVLTPNFSELLKNLDINWKYTSGDHGDPLDHGSHMLGIAYGFNKWQVRPYIYFQYFVGYGEVIRDYNRSTEEVRAGFAFHY